MKDIDARLRSALHAAADRIDADSLSPAAPPSSATLLAVPGPPARRVPRWIAPSLAAAAVAVIAIVAVALASGGNGPQTAPLPPAQSNSAPTSPAGSDVPTATPTTSATGSTPPTATPTPPASGSCPFADLGCTASSYYEPLWPFTGQAQVAAWQQQNGSQPWHLDAGQTALNFVRGYLGFTDIVAITSTNVSGTEARIGVGYPNPAGQPHTAAVLHLVRYGSGSTAPWEVVGSDDTDFSLEQPAYGSAVGTSFAVGGHITGVDENVRVQVRDSARAVISRGDLSVAAGGDNSPWQISPVGIDGSGVLTIVAWTGGHLTEHERFAIQGVHA